MSDPGEVVNTTCAFHPDRAVYAECVECNRQLCAPCTHRSDDGLASCGLCLGVIAFDGESEEPVEYGSHDSSVRSDQVNAVEDVVMIRPPPSKAEADEASQTWIAWEDSSQPSDLKAFAQTVSTGILQPIVFMQRIPWNRSDLMAPLVFAILVGMVGQVAQTLRLLADPGPVQASLQAVPQLAHISPKLFVLCMLPFLPLLLALGLFLKSWVAHLLLRLVNAATGPFETTFRVFAYTEVAAVLLLLPTFGPYAHKFYVVFLVLNGLRLGHGAGLAAGILALMPMLIFQAFAG